MDNNQVKIVIGGLLHDIGKILYRHNDGRNHSLSGFEFLKEQGITDSEILDQVRYHHSAALRSAKLDDDALAYITYWADNVASGADRRTKDGEEERKYDKFVPLESIFNILNNNEQKYSYDMETVYDDGRINYPKEGAGQYAQATYSLIQMRLCEGLKQVELTDAYVNSLLNVLEANLSFVPSSTDKSQLVDISLFDHAKMTAAIGSCIYDYLRDNHIDNYKEALWKKGEEYYSKPCFLLFSMDISGIQSFIYKVHNEGALKTLRAKSFYLEIMLEHIIDVILERIGISRANVIYSGGGHAYLILPNSDRVQKEIRDFEVELNNWFLQQFKVELYVACGYQACSAYDFMNKPDGSYKALFMGVSEELSQKKSARYTAEQIIELNKSDRRKHLRECKVCGRVDHLTDTDICKFCAGFRSISKSVQTKNFVSILCGTEVNEENILLPFGDCMMLEDENDLKNRISKDSSYIRSYSKNKLFTGFHMATNLWVGDYNHGNTFEELAVQAKGIKKLGVLRADVDNLGQAFVQGFERKDGSQRYVSLSRSATFSRKMSMFFKYHLNHILGNGVFSLQGEQKGAIKHHAVIVYSGGDDLFIIGPWNEIIEIAIDIRNELKRYTQGTLTISAGIGIFPAKYPVKTMARQVGELEDASKRADGKSSITLFEAEEGKQTYTWDRFEEKVVGEKLREMQAFFGEQDERGMSMMYNLLQYVRGLEDSINLARLAYLLGRLGPDKGASEEKKQRYQRFSKQFYQWVSGPTREEDRKELITAIYLYVYLNRGGEGR